MVDRNRNKDNEMKIGILTQPLTTNYGGILQNYALQTVLKRMGNEVWTIDHYKYTWLDWLDHAWRVLAHKMLGHDVKFGQTPPKKKAIAKYLRRFVLQHISITTPCAKYLEKKIVKKYGFDAIVVGSDQVWRPVYNKHIDKMFLSPCQNMDIKRIAYAVSFGSDKWELTPKQTKICTPLAQKFDTVSVREASGVALCRNYLNVDATHVLDPTLLLTAKDYMHLCSEIPFKEPFVFAYILEPNEEKFTEIKTFAQNKGLPYLIRSAGSLIQKDASIEKWLSQFRDAAFVITDSFHGTVFSIIFEKDFYVYANLSRGTSRFDSLLGLLDLKNRVVDGHISEKEKIDWGKVNDSIALERSMSLDFIRQNLNSI